MSRLIGQLAVNMHSFVWKFVMRIIYCYSLIDIYEWSALMPGCMNWAFIIPFAPLPLFFFFFFSFFFLSKYAHTHTYTHTHTHTHTHTNTWLPEEHKTVAPFSSVASIKMTQDKIDITRNVELWQPTGVFFTATVASDWYPEERETRGMWDKAIYWLLLLQQSYIQIAIASVELYPDCCCFNWAIYWLVLLQ